MGRCSEPERRRSQSWKRGGLRQIQDTDAIDAAIDAALAANPGQLEQYRAGKTKVLGWFVGQVMKATRGQANPALVNARLRQKLDADGAG